MHASVKRRVRFGRPGQKKCGPRIRKKRTSAFLAAQKSSCRILEQMPKIAWWKNNNFVIKKWQFCDEKVTKFARKNQDKKENTQCFCPITKNWLQIIEPTETVLNFVTRVSINNETKEAHPIFRILEHRAKSGRPVLRHAVKRRLNLLMSQIAGEWSGFCWTESEHRRYAYFVSNERKLRNYRRDIQYERRKNRRRKTDLCTYSNCSWCRTLCHLCTCRTMNLRSFRQQVLKYEIQ